MTSHSSRYLVSKSAVSVCGQSVGAITGLLLDAVILARFGVGADTDAFFAALALPGFISATLEVQLPKVLVPLLQRTETQDGADVARRQLAAIALIVSSLLAAISLMGIWCAPWLVAANVPGFSAQRRQLTAALAQLLFWLLPLRGFGAILQSGLFARHSYSAPSFSKATIQAATLLWLIPARATITIYDVAIAFIVGAFASILLQIAMLGSARQSTTLPRWRDLSSACRAMKLLPVPLLLGGLGESVDLVENLLMSFLPPGVLSAFRYASRIATAISGIIVGSVVRAALPLLSDAVARRDDHETSKRLEGAVRLVMLFGATLFVFMLFCARPLVALLFSRGRFGPAESAVVSHLVILFIPYVVVGRVLSVVQLPFYAHFKVLPTLAGSVVAVGLYAITGVPALWVAGVYGLPIVRTVTSVIAVLITYRMAQAMFGIQIRWTRIAALPLRVTLQFGAACLIGSIAVTFLPHGSFSPEISRFLGPLIAGAIGLVASLTSALGIRSVKQFRNLLIPAVVSTGKVD